MMSILSLFGRNLVDQRATDKLYSQNVLIFLYKASGQLESHNCMLGQSLLTESDPQGKLFLEANKVV